MFTVAVLAREVVAVALKFGKIFTAVSIIFLNADTSIWRFSSTFNWKAKARGEIFLVADHYVHTLGNRSVDFLRKLLPPIDFQSEGR